MCSEEKRQNTEKTACEQTTRQEDYYYLYMLCHLAAASFPQNSDTELKLDFTFLFKHLSFHQMLYNATKNMNRYVCVLQRGD